MAIVASSVLILCFFRYKNVLLQQEFVKECCLLVYDKWEPWLEMQC